MAFSYLSVKGVQLQLVDTFQLFIINLLEGDFVVFPLKDVYFLHDTE